MKRFLLPLFLLKIFGLGQSEVAKAEEKFACSDGELHIEFPVINGFPYDQTRIIRFKGKLETPESKRYMFAFTREEFVEGDVRLTLHLRKKEELDESVNTNSFVLISHMLGVPAAATGIFIDVSKDFTGSPEYFRGKFDGYKPLCLLPEMYK